MPIFPNLEPEYLIKKELQHPQPNPVFNEGL